MHRNERGEFGMKRHVRLEDISDGCLYTSGDMVRVGCHDCEGCFSCCQGMGNSLVLDPMDIYQMTTHLGKTFEQLLESAVALNVVDGIVLPNMKMEDSQERCTFLNAEGRCNIHAFRPGICRLFPLGRIYEEDGFKYFIQIHECPKPNKTKVRVRQWLGITDLKTYEAYINQWHDFVNAVEAMLETSEDEQVSRNVSMLILKTLYIQPYVAERSFYEQFGQRIALLANTFGI